MRIALATCREPPEPDVDEPLLVSALRAAGAEADVLAWDDPGAPFADYDLVVVRSTWNYYEHLEAFLAWAERVGRATRVLNDPATVRWNAVKTYLRDLEARGVPVVPTDFVARGEHRELGELVRARGWDRVVVKPLVSAGSFRTERFASDDVAAGQAFLDALSRDRDVMIQEWMPAVDTYGERSLVWIDGEVTHAIRKSPRFAGGVEQVSDEVAVTEDERAFAHRVVEPIAKERGLLYARVDTIRDGDVLRIMELELVEPSLFFKQCPRALDRFVRAAIERSSR
jgi:glutathione synthase/RimK-type ligase-like ATP-grasp enzyme